MRAGQFTHILFQVAGQSLSRSPLDVDSIASFLDEYLEVEFTFIHTEELSAVLAGMSRERQDFILEWTRRAAATNTELAFQFANRARQALLEVESSAGVELASGVRPGGLASGRRGLRHGGARSGDTR